MVVIIGRRAPPLAVSLGAGTCALWAAGTVTAVVTGASVEVAARELFVAFPNGGKRQPPSRVGASPLATTFGREHSAGTGVEIGPTPISGNQPSKDTANRMCATKGMKKLAHRRASAKPVSSAVLLRQDADPRNAGTRGAHTTGPTHDPNEFFRRDNRDTPTGDFHAVIFTFKTTVREESPAGRLNGQSLWK